MYDFVVLCCLYLYIGLRCRRCCRRGRRRLDSSYAAIKHIAQTGKYQTKPVTLFASCIFFAFDFPRPIHSYFVFHCMELVSEQ